MQEFASCGYKGVAVHVSDFVPVIKIILFSINQIAASILIKQYPRDFIILLLKNIDYLNKWRSLRSCFKKNYILVGCMLRTRFLKLNTIFCIKKIFPSTNNLLSMKTWLLKTWPLNHSCWYFSSFWSWILDSFV